MVRGSDRRAAHALRFWLTDDDREPCDGCISADSTSRATIAGQPRSIASGELSCGSSFVYPVLKAVIADQTIDVRVGIGNLEFPFDVALN